MDENNQGWPSILAGLAGVALVAGIGFLICLVVGLGIAQLLMGSDWAGMPMFNRLFVAAIPTGILFWALVAYVIRSEGMIMITMDQIEWRDSEIADVVAVLNLINPKGYSAEEIKRHAFRAFTTNADGSPSDEKPTFVGTAGWYVTIVHKGYESDKPYIALVSLMAYSVRQWLEIKKEAV